MFVECHMLSVMMLCFLHNLSVVHHSISSLSELNSQILYSGMLGIKIGMQLNAPINPDYLLSPPWKSLVSCDWRASVL